MNSQMKKGIVELCIMKLIKTKKSSTFEILNKMRTLEVNENTIYPILRRLHNEGFLKQEKGNNDVGAPRKYYDLTEKGVKELSEQISEWLDFTSSVDQILKEGYNE
ncbi:MAG: PadR family transcriptional regulator [Tenericutes bacterium]|nr:PadR family transcriptional regulator [Mycoplasmatota bacterium]